MPITHVTMKPRAEKGIYGYPSEAYFLKMASKEIIPAGCHSEQGPLTPGNIIFVPSFAQDGPDADVFIEVEMYPYEDRMNLDERAAAIKAAYKKLFPDITFTVVIKPVEMGLASDFSDTDSGVDMSMEAAIQRAKVAIHDIYRSVGENDSIPG